MNQAHQHAKPGIRQKINKLIPPTEIRFGTNWKGMTSSALVAHKRNLHLTEIIYTETEMKTNGQRTNSSERVALKILSAPC